MDEPPMGEECFPICVPDGECGPDMHMEMICEVATPPEPPPCVDPEEGCDEPPPPPPEECFEICVPNQGYCPPGTEPYFECNEFDDCFEDCIPIEWGEGEEGGEGFDPQD